MIMQGSRCSHQVVSIACILLASLVGCGEEATLSDDTTPPVVDSTELDKLKAELDGVRKQLRESRLAANKAVLDAQRLERDRQALIDAKADTKEIDTQVAVARTDLQEKMEAIIRALEDHRCKWNQVLAASNEPTVETFPTTVTGPDLEDFVKGVLEGEDVEPKLEVTEGDAGSEGSEAMNQVLKLAAAAVVMYNPALAPFVGALSEMLGIFDSVEEKEQFLGTVTSLAAGGQLTPEQKSLLLKKVIPKIDGLDPKAVALLEAVASQDPDLKNEFVKVFTGVIEKDPLVKAIIESLKDADLNSVEDAIKKLPDLKDGYASQAQKEKVVSFAQATGLDPKVIQALRAFPVRN